jgi:hypothetical protein
MFGFHMKKNRLTSKDEPRRNCRSANPKAQVRSEQRNRRWLRRIVRCGGFKFEVRQIKTGCCPDISVPTQAPSSYGVRVCIETEMASSLQTVADLMHDLSHFKFEN